MPRVSGKSTRVIITEYDLPNRVIQPHDVVLDREGMVWYSDFGQMLLGKMDPKTARVPNIRYLRPKRAFRSERSTLSLIAMTIRGSA